VYYFGKQGVSAVKITLIDDLAVSFGRSTRESVEQLGAIAQFFWRSIVHFPGLLARPDILVDQMMHIGVGSLPIVLLVSSVTGLIVTWQFAYLASDVVPLTYLGTVVVKASFTAMGPTFAALILAGRVSARLASELGTMKVTEQMDAMTCLSLDVHYYLFAPRILSSLLMTTVLFVFASFTLIMSAQILATVAFEVSPYTFFNGMRLLFKVQDVIIMLVKGFVFGGILSVVGCYHGYITTGGAVGVGQSTKNAVVAASVLILAGDVVINQLMM
jgi:phospholipid/cholesterol/gamma-HCH transport system permease protein